MPDGSTESQSVQLDFFDFQLNVYKGCVLPEDYKPARTTTWRNWLEENLDDYTQPQLELIRQRLIAGKSWVCFCTSLETIAAPDYYKPQPSYSNPVKPKERLV